MLCLSKKFLKAVFHKIYLVHSWILCLIFSYLVVVICTSSKQMTNEVSNQLSIN